MARRLLAVHAHPDDESSKGSATYAFYRNAGDDVLIVSCTGGERGDVQNESLEPKAMAERDMAGLRRIEMATAQSILDVQHLWLGYQDSGLPDEGESPAPQGFAMVPLEISGPSLVGVIRRYKPHVLITYDENGGYPHPDHIRTHEISLWAMDAAADPALYPELGDSWTVQKLYYERIFNPERIHAVHDTVAAADPEHPLLAQMAEMRSWMDGRPAGSSRVPAGDFFEQRDAALLAHASQVAPDSSFFFWPNELQRKAWPYEDFELVRSQVETTMPETDLFAGIEEDA